MANQPQSPEAKATGPHPPAMTADQACDIINAWSARGFFRLRNMGDKIFLSEVVQGSAFNVRLQTHYEHRTVRPAKTPYRGEAVDDRGRSPAPWEINVAQPSPFEERTQVIPIPHTERVQICGRCQGQRRITCSTCQGTGQTICGTCGGSGITQHQIFDQVRDASGQVVSVPKLVQRQCHCGNGRILCTTCQGNRVLTCPECTGTGSVKTFDELVVRFQVASQGELVDVTPVPDKWLTKRTGEVLLDVRETRVSLGESIPEGARAKVKELIDRSHDVDAATYRIILQQLRVERIPIYEVRYKYAGEEKALWICGAEQAIHAPGAPWNRNRMYGLFAATVIPLGLLIFWLVIWMQGRG